MRVDQIEIHAGAVEFEYEALRHLEAKCEARTAFSEPPTMGRVNQTLQEMAAGIGANAVIHVAYKSGMSMTSWRSMTGTGLAVRRLSDTVPCPRCAEQIKRAATVCRFCGAEVVGVVEAPASRAIATPAPVPSRVSASLVGLSAAQRFEADRLARAARAGMPEPLKSNDNPWRAVTLALVCVIAALYLLAALG
jgi:hypothetical protein